MVIVNLPFKSPGSTLFQVNNTKLLLFLKAGTLCIVLRPIPIFLACLSHVCYFFLITHFPYSSLGFFFLHISFFIYLNFVIKNNIQFPIPFLSLEHSVFCLVRAYFYTFIWIFTTLINAFWFSSLICDLFLPSLSALNHSLLFPFLFC